jgi:[ribosomal protein S5]-alanine N-acetyltransferase
LSTDPLALVTAAGLTGKLRSDAEIRRHFDRVQQRWREDGFGWWTFRDADGLFVARGGLGRVVVEGRPEVEVGYAVRASHWGRGIATAIAEMSLDVGFHTVGLSRVVSFTLPFNLRSRRVMEKAGLLYERDVVYAGMPHVLYAVTPGDRPGR